MGPYTFAPEMPRVVRYPNDPDDPVTIGAYGSIAANVEFVVGGNHRVDWVSTFAFRHVLGAAGRGHRRMPAVGRPDRRRQRRLDRQGRADPVGRDDRPRRRDRARARWWPRTCAPTRSSWATRRARCAGASATSRWRRCSPRSGGTWPPAEVLSIVDLLNGADVERVSRSTRARDRSRSAPEPERQARSCASAAPGPVDADDRIGDLARRRKSVIACVHVGSA